jgi:hypothetical protein
MQKNIGLQKEVIESKLLLKSEKTNIYAKTGKYLKRFFYLVSLVIAVLFFNGCQIGYITFNESAKPARPGNEYVWINGDWVYDTQTKAYVQKTGYWVKPEKDRTFLPGYWQTTERGYHWVSGQWVTHL